jgi:hypothetical protein
MAQAEGSTEWPVTSVHNRITGLDIQFASTSVRAFVKSQYTPITGLVGMCPGILTASPPFHIHFELKLDEEELESLENMRR